MKWNSFSLKPYRRMYVFTLAGVLLASSTVFAAKPTESDVLATMVNSGVQPSLVKVASSARGLANSVEQLCKQRDTESLEQARSAWLEAYKAWRRSAPFMFGPADNQKLERRLGRWLLNEVVVEAVVTSADFSHLRNGEDVRGYAGVEYLLFVPGNAEEATTVGRCDHLLDITGEIADLTFRTRQEWEQSFGKEFVSAGDGKPFLIPGDALSMVLAETLNVTEILLRDRIGVPSSFFEGDAKPKLLEAWHSNSSTDAFQAALEGVRQVLTGGESASVANLVATRDGLVSTKNPALAADLSIQLDKVEEAIVDLGGHDMVLYKEVQVNSAKLKHLYKQIQKLQDQIIEVTLVLELDIQASGALAVRTGN